jgi:transglutaminase-like putative cysteine protease
MKTLLSIDMRDRGPYLRTCFVGFSYLLAALGVACLIFGAVIPLSAGILVVTALAVCFTLEIHKKIPVIPPIRLSIWVAGLVILPLIYFTIKPPVLDLAVWSLIFILLTRFVFKSELNDYLYGYLISIVCLLIGAIFIQDLIFGILFLSFYLVLCWCLMFYNMMVERVGTHCPPAGFRRTGENETTGLSLFALSSLIILASFLLTAAIFISFPRMGLGFLALDSGKEQISGFSSRVELGDVGRIKQNDSVVMRVEFHKNGKAYRPPSKVLWRGISLDHYDGTTWFSTMPPAWSTFNRGDRGVPLFAVPAPREMVVQDIYMETFDSPVVFTYGIPIKLEGTFKSILMDQGFSLKIIDHRTGPRRFTFISDVGHPVTNYPNPVYLNSRHLFPKRFLQLPEISPRIRRLSQTLVKNSDSPALVANKILFHLKNKYGYSLDLKRNSQVPALDDFLFERKEGHCEYFASAMAVLLRLNGIPSRIINGFAGSEWNDLGQYMVVRQAHAHSWVEAYIEGQGWQVYDPTPSDPSAAALSPSLLASRLDLMKLYWQRYIIRYSTEDQIQLANYFNRETQNFKNRWKEWKIPSFKEILDFFRNHPLSLVAVIAVLLGWRLWTYKYQWQGAPWASRSPVAVQMYRQMLGRLQAQGIIKSKNETHLEFLANLAGLPLEKREATESITRIYERHRFGKLPFSPGEQAQIRSLIRQI